MRSRAVHLAVVASILCATTQAVASVARRGQVVMGTVLTVTVVAADDATADSLAEAAIDEARLWDDALTIWRSDGELAALNAKAGQGPTTISPRLATGLAAMLEFARQTGGAFEPAIGSLAHGRPQPGGRLRGTAEALRLGEGRAELDAGSVLDPGGIGKGLALDAIVRLLRAKGASAAFLDFGGSSQTAIGSPPGDREGWTVVVSGWDEGATHGTVKLRDASLSTSRSGAVDTTPIIDPRSGKPVPGRRLATVRSADATAADAWSTALVVLGRDGLGSAEAHHLDVLLEDESGVARTSGFAGLR